MSSCSMLEKLGNTGGVVWTFKPTNAVLVRCLHDQIRMCGTPNFPEIEIYGKSGVEPWVIWESYPEFEIPHQKFLYFYTRVKVMSKTGKGSRCSRRLGNGATWSETSVPTPFDVPDLSVYAKLRKFRYEHKGSKHNGGWLMDEFSIDRSCLDSDLVLCRIKINESKRKRQDDDDQIARATKALKPNTSSDPQDSFDFDVEQLFNSDPNLCLDADALYSILHEDEEQQHQLDVLPPPSINNFNSTSGDMVESSTGVAESEDTGWLDQAIEEASSTAILQHQHHSTSTGNEFSFSCWDDETIPSDFQPHQFLL